MALEENITIDRIFELAEQCILSGNRPMPAILIKNGCIAFESQDKVFEANDPTMHGEIAVIRKACSDLKTLSLKGYGMVCFCEPCLMCCGAIHWSKLDWIAYCLTQSTLKDLSNGQKKPGICDYLPLGRNNLSIYGPIRDREAFSIASKYDWIGNAVVE